MFKNVYYCSLPLVEYSNANQKSYLAMDKKPNIVHILHLA